MLFLLPIFLSGEEDNKFLLFGIRLIPSPCNLSDSWVITQGGDYYIVGSLTIGFETGMAYRIFEDNVFFNSKVKIFQKGIFRPYGIFGLGLLTNINYHPGENSFEKFSAFHFGSGVNIGKSGGAGLQIEFRLMRSNQEGSKTKFLLVCGIEY